MAFDVLADPRQDKLATHELSPFALPPAQKACPAPWSTQNDHQVPWPCVAPAPAAAAAPAAPEHAQSPGGLASLWEGAKGLGSQAYRGLTGWNFEGRDAHNGHA